MWPPQVWKPVWKITFFGLKYGLDSTKRSAHCNQEFPRELYGLWFGVLSKDTRRLARLDAHTYVYKGQKFHAPFLNWCILNYSFYSFFFQGIERLSDWNKKWEVVKTGIQVREKKNIQQFSPDFSCIFPFLSSLIWQRHFYFHAYYSNLIRPE